ncbi:MAG: methyl-accepting chemotaxis protein [Lachnospira sp.]|nr:methyl-accepting chemotaxis protein [Lachnospira sp.]
MNGKGEVLGQDAARNRVGLIAHCTEAVIITLAYIMEFVKGSRTIPYVIIISALALIPALLELFFYKKNPRTTMVKHLLGYGYAVLYMAIMFTTNNTFAFVYVIPMLIAITVFDDLKYSIKINIGVFIVNVIEVIILLNNGIYTKSDSASIEIQLFVMLLVSVFSIYTTAIVEKVNKNKLDELNEHQEQLKRAQEKTAEASKYLVEEIEGINEKINILSESLASTREAMAEVNSGSTDTATAVQNQLVQTEAIQNKVEQVAEEKEVILDSTNTTQKAIDDGNRYVSLLVEQVEKSVESGAVVTKELTSLDEYMNQMHSIVDIIAGITEQTSLLSLNASIEAARAGEAGRGFAVVASEISKMANQTQDATVNITGLIENVSDAIVRVIRVSEQMIDMIQSQNETTSLTAESFQIISSNSQKVADNAESLASVVGELEKANREIIDSISTISAISEEVAAHASDTLESSEHNIEIINQTSQSALQLKEYAGQL